MKSIILSILFLSLIKYCFAQEKAALHNEKNVIKAGLNTYFVEDPFVFNIALEHKIAVNKSLQLEVMPVFFKNKSVAKNGVGFAISYRNYLPKGNNDLSGIYISPMLKTGFVNIKYSTGFETKVTNINAAFLFGKQWFFENKLVLDFNGGIGFFKNYSTPEIIYLVVDKDKLSYNKSSVSPNFNLKVGYAF